MWRENNKNKLQLLRALSLSIYLQISQVNNTQSGIEHPDDPLCVRHLKHLTKLGIDIDEVSTGYLGNIGCLLMWLYKRTPTSSLFEISGSVIHRMQRQHTDLHQLTDLHHPKALCDVRDVNLMYTA